MQFFKASVLAALVASVAALQVTQPASQAAIDVSKKNTITWTSVSTDPSSFAISLVNMAVNPSVSISLTNSVQTSAGSYTFGPLTGVTPGQDYQVNLISTSANNEGILAQSGQFSIVSSGSSTTSVSFSSSTPSTSGMSSTTSASSTITSTASTSGASSASGASSSTSGAFSFGNSTSSAAASTTSGSSGSSGTSSASSSLATHSAGAAAGLHAASGAAGLGFVAVIAALFA